MKYNDKLHSIIVNDLNPYGLVARPLPQLSLFFDFDKLIIW
jgi:hypothetical protein